jgi:putative hydrolase of the HAD superfamily
MLEDKVLVFDVDNTLYQAGDLVDQKEDVNIKRFFAEKLNIDENGAWQIIQDIRSRYRYDVDALESEYPFSKYEFMEKGCRVDMSFLKPNLELNTLLQSIPQTKIIFTDNTANHVSDVFNAVGIDADNFVGIFDAHSMNYTFKHQNKAFEMMLEHFKVNPTNCIMFEDNITNLQMAKNFEMTTVLINPTIIEKPQFVDYMFTDITSALKYLTGN